MRSVRARMCGITTSLAEMWLYSARKWCSVTHTYFQFDRSPASAIRVSLISRSCSSGVVAPVEVVGDPAADEESELHGGMIADLTTRQGTARTEQLDIDDPIYPCMPAAHRLLSGAGAGRVDAPAELARRAGTSQPVISAYEPDGPCPSVRTLARTCEPRGSSSSRSPERAPATHSLRSAPRSTAVEVLDVLSVVDTMPRRPRCPELDAPAWCRHEPAHLAGKIVAIHEAMERIRHGFGGTLALA